MARSAKKRHQKKSKATESLMADVRKLDEFKDIEIVEPAKNIIKMSDAIDELLEPYEHLAKNMKAYKKLLSVACMAWNIALMPKNEEDAAVQEFLSDLPDTYEELEKDMIELMKSLIKRKNLLYPNDIRLIVKHKITENKNDIDLSIAYMTNK